MLYRPEYGLLMNLKSHFLTVPLMALTTIQDQLLTLLKNPISETSTVNKSNISFHAIELTKLPKHGMVKIFECSRVIIITYGTSIILQQCSRPCD